MDLAIEACESAVSAPSCNFDDVVNVAVESVMSLTSAIHYITPAPPHGCIEDGARSKCESGMF